MHDTRWRLVAAVARYRFSVPLALFGLAIAGILGAWTLFPDDTPVYQPRPLIFDINPSASLLGVDIDVIPLGSKRFKVALSMDAIPENESTPPTIETTMIIPIDATVDGCNLNRCHTPQQTLTMALRADPSTGLRNWTAETEHTVDGAEGVILDANEGTIEGALPQVSANGQVKPTVSVSVDVPDALQYDWTAGPPPFSVEPERVTWSLSPDDLRAPVAVTAVNRQAQAKEATNTFISGVLFGVAGGAVVAALQELLHVHPPARNADVSRRRQTSRYVRSPLSSRRRRHWLTH